ncbi:hypothetical protein [Sphingomonas sp. 28-63-12]|uniref:hypothetical protein n=1 Tax=Sphingomonas sp. 28-63-12 TaxID=1970434 RepID=UPI0035A96C5F
MDIGEDKRKKRYLRHYVDGDWIESEGGTRHVVISPATEEPTSEVTPGTAVDLAKAVIGDFA